MARGIDKDSESRAILSRRNPFIQKISDKKEKELEERRGQAASQEDINRIENEEAFEIQQIKEEEELEIKETEVNQQFKESYISQKKTELETLLNKRKEYLLSLGSEDLSSDTWDQVLGKAPGLIAQDYKIQISPVNDSYLQEQGKNYAFSLSYSDEAILLDDQIDLEARAFSFLPKSQDEKILDEALLERIAVRRRYMQLGEVISQGFAVSEDEARKKAEKEMNKSQEKILREIQKAHSLVLESKKRESDLKKREAEAEAKREAQEQEAKKRITKTTAMLKGLDWSNAADKKGQERIKRLASNARELKREKIGSCDLVTYFTDFSDQGFEINKHSFQGAIFYKGDLRAIIYEDSDGSTYIHPASLNSLGLLSMGGIKEKIFTPSFFIRKRRDKRNADPVKNRPRLEAAARKYIETLLEEETLKNIT